jgi:hypothetical protein
MAGTKVGQARGTALGAVRNLFLCGSSTSVAIMLLLAESLAGIIPTTKVPKLVPVLRTTVHLAMQPFLNFAVYPKPRYTLLEVAMAALVGKLRAVPVGEAEMDLMLLSAAHPSKLAQLPVCTVEVAH